MSNKKKNLLTVFQKKKKRKKKEKKIFPPSKSAKIVFSKSIFEVKNQLNFSKKNLGLGQIFYPKE